MKSKNMTDEVIDLRAAELAKAHRDAQQVREIYCILYMTSWSDFFQLREERRSNFASISSPLAQFFLCMCVRVRVCVLNFPRIQPQKRPPRMSNVCSEGPRGAIDRTHVLVCPRSSRGPRLFSVFSGVSVKSTQTHRRSFGACFSALSPFHHPPPGTMSVMVVKQTFMKSGSIKELAVGQSDICTKILTNWVEREKKRKTRKG